MLHTILWAIFWNIGINSLLIVIQLSAIRSHLEQLNEAIREK